MLIAIASLKRAFGKVEPNMNKIRTDLENNWAVVTEGIQTILRRENYPDPYSALKDLARSGENESLSLEIVHAWIDKLNISDELKDELKAITPFNYVGK
jgi:adenylosuccinate lyase